MAEAKAAASRLEAAAAERIHDHHLRRGRVAFGDAELGRNDIDLENGEYEEIANQQSVAVAPRDGGQWVDDVLVADFAHPWVVFIQHPPAPKRPIGPLISIVP